MPFTCQLKLPSFHDSPIEAQLKSWKRKPFVVLEREEEIADIAIGGISYSLCVNFPCGLSYLVAEEGNAIKTGDRVAVCIAEGEDISYGKDYLFIRAV